MSKSFAAEVIADSTGHWCGNQLRFRTSGEAEAYAADLALRWTLVREWRVVPSDQKPTHNWNSILYRAVPLTSDGQVNTGRAHAYR